MTALLPCPFCGGEPRLGQWTTDYVRCDDCNAQQIGLTQVEAIAAWNRRAAPASPASSQSQALDAPKPAAWRVKVFGVGWLFYNSEEEALCEVAATGGLMQALYAEDGTQSPSVSQDAPKPEPTLQRTGEGVEAEPISARRGEIARLIRLAMLDNPQHFTARVERATERERVAYEYADQVIALLSEGSVKGSSVAESGGTASPKSDNHNPTEGEDQ